MGALVNKLCQKGGCNLPVKLLKVPEKVKCKSENTRVFPELLLNLYFSDGGSGEEDDFGRT